MFWDKKWWSPINLWVKQTSWAYLNLLESITWYKRSSLRTMINRKWLKTHLPEDCAEFIEVYFSKKNKKW